MFRSARSGQAAQCDERECRCSTIPRMRTLTREWWSSSVDYRWVHAYFQQHGLDRAIRALIASAAAALGGVAGIMLVSQAGPQGWVGTAVVAVSAAAAGISAVRWLMGPWPSRAESQLFVMFAAVGIPLVCWQYTDRVIGLCGLNSLALVSIHVALFHGPRLLLWHTGWTLGCLITFGIAVGVSGDGDAAVAVAQSLASVMIIAAAPPVLQLIFWILRTDADHSTIDALTGLLNRRGLYARAAQFAGEADRIGDGEDLVVMIIDLDRFKDVNDAHGHAVGDRVLIRSARRIQATVRASAVLARLGGEEFLLLDSIPRARAAAVADRIRTALSDPADPVSITASIGVAAVSADAFRAAHRELAPFLDTIIDRADQAMYRAKQAGRNNVATDLDTSDRHTSATDPPLIPPADAMVPLPLAEKRRPQPDRRAGPRDRRKNDERRRQ